MANDAIEEPLTPSNLILGQRMLSVPTHYDHDNEDFNVLQDVLSRRMQHLRPLLEKVMKGMPLATERLSWEVMLRMNQVSMPASGWCSGMKNLNSKQCTQE